MAKTKTERDLRRTEHAAAKALEDQARAEELSLLSSPRRKLEEARALEAEFALKYSSLCLEDTKGGKRETTLDAALEFHKQNAVMPTKAIWTPGL